MNRLSTSMACNLLADFAKTVSFSGYGWLTVMAVLDSSEDYKTAEGYKDILFTFKAHDHSSWISKI